MDPVFDEEQQHLHNTYAKLVSIEKQLNDKLAHLISDASESINHMKDEITLNLSDDGQASETSIELETLNSLIDAYNLSNDINTEKLHNTQLLLKKPYFAKISLQFKPDAPVKNIYIGAAGMTDDNYRHFIVDWRSPIAEVYYNQENGATSYRANGRTINVDLKLRRQFDIDEQTLHAYFDTTIAIEDPLLLASLSKHRNAHMQDITMTIQKEQNQAIRHEDVPVLLVNGIAGSGKTSVLLQRIAYLFYTYRETLSPDNVCLITPNPVFQKYIDNVLPDMGERNPRTLTYKELMNHLGAGERGNDSTDNLESLTMIDERVHTLRLSNNDFCDIKLGNKTVVAASQAQSLCSKYKHIPVGPRLIALVNEELCDRLESKVRGLMKSDSVHAEIMDLPVKTQRSIFGHQIFPQTEHELRDYAAQYLEALYTPIFEEVHRSAWLRFDRIGMHMLNKTHLTPTEWIYLKLAITGEGERDVRFVMIDEVQDYSLSQLTMLSRYFYNAHFLLLGDENQAIKPNTANFKEIKALFESMGKPVSECRLMTSYRSSPEITQLFSSLLDESTRIEVSSVQRPGVTPQFVTCEDEEAYEQALLKLLDEAQADQGLVAFIAPSKKQARKVHTLFNTVPEERRPLLVEDNARLPEQGVIVLELSLAKGLEFDSVVICNAEETFYPDSPLSRRRLYTAISRATQQVALVAQGSFTSLIDPQGIS